MALVGLSAPASAGDGDVTATQAVHCTYTRIAITNETGATIEARAVVNGTPQAWVAIDPTSTAPAVRIESTPDGETVVVQWRLPGDDASIADLVTFTNTLPERCDDFTVSFTDSCDSTTVSVTNNHGSEVYLRIYAPLGNPVYDDGDDDDPTLPDDWFQDSENYTNTFPMSAGDEMIVEITFSTGLIDYVGWHDFVPTGCAPEPEYPTTIVDTCTGIKVTVTNDSDEPLPVHVYKQSTDEFYAQFNVAPGETETVEVEVRSGTKIEVLSVANKLDLGRHTVARKDCPDLPKTGTDVKTIAFVGLGVLLAGAAVLFVLRQRRRKLTQQ